MELSYPSPMLTATSKCGDFDARVEVFERRTYEQASYRGSIVFASWFSTFELGELATNNSKLQSYTDGLIEEAQLAVASRNLKRELP